MNNDTALKGTVLEVKDGIIFASGLEDVGINELVEIYTDEFKAVEGIVLDLDITKTGIVALGDFTGIKAGDSILAKQKLPGIAVNENYLGRVIDPLGKELDGKGKIDLKDAKEMPLDKVAPGVIARKDVERPLQTGVLAIDAMIPIGRGQRELVIGDRQTGKTAIAVDTIINQKDKDCYCIYVNIGQKTSKIAQLISQLEQTDALSNTIIVSATASTNAALQYLAPFVGTAIAEYYAEKGKDVLIVYDDLTKHAQAYREISLLLRRPSGREAYPGDIFYLHSKLLERSLQFSDALGGGSITALPLLETQAGDISAYIPTNIISITDGQIFLETDLFNAGQKPAISVGTSVSRVGGAAQTKSMKGLAGQMKLELAQYRELAAFAQYGSDLDQNTKQRLDKGARLMELLKQDQYQPLQLGEMLIVLFAASKGFLEQVPLPQVLAWRDFLFKDINTEKVIKEIDFNSKIEGATEKKLASHLEKVSREFIEQNIVEEADE